jgi:WXXGXW repeat (2 copies)
VNSKHNFKLAAFLGIVSLLVVLSASFGAVAVSVGIAPPPLPVYTQPLCPGPNYIWTPGYWAYGPDGYYWVAGTWILAPQPGLLWTPGYWGFVNGSYLWNAGYWGPTVGFYGGVNYGFGYFGTGFAGGRWVGRNFDYNTAVMNVNRNVVHNTYVDRSVIRNTTNRTSFNGPGGITVRPTAAETAAGRERRVGPTAAQTGIERNAGANRNNLYSVNRGRPDTMATSVL